MPMKTVKIRWIKRTERTAKSGKNKGKPFTSVSLLVEGSDVFIGAYGHKSNEGWKVGDEITVDIEANKVTRDGEEKTYYNVKNPSGKISQEDFTKLSDRVTTLELELSVLKAQLGLSNGSSTVKEAGEVKENLPV